MTTTLLAALMLLLSGATASAQDRSTSALARTTLSVTTPSEGVATLTARCTDCDWAVAGREGVLLEVRVDGEYSQHIVLVRGRERSDYRVLLGHLAPGEHVITIAQDWSRSAVGAGAAAVERLTAVALDAHSPDFDIVSRAPFLRARPGSVERFSDVPLLMYAERNAGSEGPAPYDVQYTVISISRSAGRPPIG